MASVGWILSVPPDRFAGNMIVVARYPRMQRDAQAPLSDWLEAPAKWIEGPLLAGMIGGRRFRRMDNG